MYQSIGQGTSQAER